MNLHKTKIDLPKKVREPMVKLLQDRLADATDLQSQAKQAHWNVKGLHFYMLHQLFDDIYEDLAEHVDTIAERLVILGGTAHGTVRMAAKASSLPEYPSDIFSGKEHVDALSTALADFGKKVRKAADEADEAGDQDTSDMFTEVSRAIDKWLWFVEAHQQEKV